jgi:hypothetical protein
VGAAPAACAFFPMSKPSQPLLPQHIFLPRTVAQNHQRALCRRSLQPQSIIAVQSHQMQPSRSCVGDDMAVY